MLFKQKGKAQKVNLGLSLFCFLSLVLRINLVAGSACFVLRHWPVPAMLLKPAEEFAI
jgi:hypothetical protein